MDRNRSIFFTKSIKRALAICCQIPNYRVFTTEEIEEYLDEINHLCGHDGVNLALIENNYHRDLSTLLKHDDTEIQRKVISILLKIIKQSPDNIQDLISDVTISIGDIIQHSNNSLTRELGLGFLAEVYKDSYDNILSVENQKHLRNCLINSMNWKNLNIVSDTLYLLSIGPDHESVVAEFLIGNIEHLNLILQEVSINEKLGVITCKLLLTFLDFSKMRTAFNAIVESHLNDTLMKVLFQSHSTISSNYYLMVMKLLCKILFVNYDSKSHSFVNDQKHYLNTLIQKYQSVIISFLLESIKRYNVKEITICGLKIFYLTLLVSKTLKNVLNVTDQEYWIHFIQDILRVNLSSPDYIYWSFRVICRIISLNPKFVSMIENQTYKDDLALDSIIIQIHYSQNTLTPKSFCSSCDALATLASYSEKIQNRFLESQIHTMIHLMRARFFQTKFLNSETEYQIRMSSVKAFRSLVIFNLPAKELFFNENDQYAEAKRFLMNVAFHKHPCVNVEEPIAATLLFLASLIEYNPIKYDLILGKTFDIYGIISCEICFKNISIIEAVQELLLVMSGLENETQYLLDILSIEKWLEIANKNSNVYAIQKNTIIFLQLNTTNIERSKLPSILVNIANMIFRSTRLFHNSLILKIEAAVLVQILIKKYPEFVRICVENDIDKFLFETININSSEELVQVTLQAFHILIESNNTRELILKKAVKQSNLPLLQCMIDVGSDVSNISSDLLLLAVKQKPGTNNTHLILILLNKGCRPTDYIISNCFQFNNYSNAGLLLRFYCIHESDFGHQINWSGLGMRHFYISWMRNLYQEIDIEVNTNIKWLAKRIKQESKNRMTLRKLYQCNQKSQTKLMRYPSTQMRTLEKNVCGYSYPTKRKHTVSTNIYSIPKSSPIGSINIPSKDKCASLYISNFTQVKKNSFINNATSDEFLWVNNATPIQKDDQYSYVAIPGEVNEFLTIFRCGSDYSYHSLDPRCLLSAKPRQSEENIIMQNIHESNFNKFIKMPTNRNRYDNVAQSSNTESNYMSDLNSETKGDISQVSHLDLSKNKLVDIDEFADISKDVSLIKMFKNTNSIKLENNLIHKLSETAFQAFESLEIIDLSGNRLNRFPWEIFKYCPLVRLNISKNKITTFHVSDEEKSILKSFCKLASLRQLLMSENTFTQFDVGSLDIFPNLQILDIQTISVSTIGSKTLPLPELLKLNVKNNHLTNINEDFLKFSKNLVSLNVNENKIKTINNSLTINLALFENLTSVDFSHNNLACSSPYFIPKCILKIPNLQNIDMSYNNITEFPPCALWMSSNLRDINFSHNMIQYLDFNNAKNNFQHLQQLDLSNNLLRKIPSEIGDLIKLTYLNISHNPYLKCLPVEIGRLHHKNLNTLLREGVTLNIPKNISQNSQLREILQYYYNCLNRSVPYNELKLMVLGFGGRGKTSLLKALQNKKEKHVSVSATIGIEVSSWILQSKYLDKPIEYKFACWDMAGQEEVLCTNECFLSKRALYLLVFDITKEIEEVQILKPWLWNLKSQAPHAPIIAVGTHLDKLAENVVKGRCAFMKSSIQKLSHTPGFPKIFDVIFVDARSPNASINNLRTKIINALNDHSNQNDQMINEKQPSVYLRLKEIVQEAVKNLPQDYPILTQKEIKDLINKHNIEIDTNEFNQAIQFLHDSGIIIHFNDTRVSLNDLYFLEPQWLPTMMKKVLTLRTLNPFIHNGIIKISDFLHQFKTNFHSTDNHARQCLKILERFDVFFQSSPTEIVIPSKLPSRRPMISQSDKFDTLVPKISRVFEFTFLPTGFWPRLIARICVLTRSFEEQFKICKLERILWKSGVIISIENSIYLVLEGKQNRKEDLEIIDISFTRSELGMRILVQIVDCIEVLIDEWYFGLNESYINGNPIMISYALCPECNSKLILMDIVQQSERSDEMSCNECTQKNGVKRSFPIRTIAPDIVLGDLPNDLIINSALLEIDKCEENRIGIGGSGEVYKGVYMGKECAVKYLHKYELTSDTPSYRMLRQEIDILRRFQHPSLISLIAVDGARIILEYAPHRDLRHVLSNYILSRRLLQRIAYQVIVALQFLHGSGIIYRDVKMQNVLVFSLELSANINVKLGDYGISRPVAPFGFVNPQGTAGYQAPEVIKKNSTYELPADIYSFGILLYNIATRGHHPADSKTHWRAGAHNELIAVHQCNNWPRMQDCINKCTELVPEDRPTAGAVSKFLICPSFITVKALWPLTKKTRIECMISMINKEGKVEVFLANGNQFKQEVRRLELVSGHSKGKPFINDKSSRILCMNLIDDLIYLGIQNGQMFVYDYVGNVFISTTVQFMDSILCMINLKIADISKCLIVGLANGTVQYLPNFTSISGLEATDFQEIYLSNLPVYNLYLADDHIFATCGSGIYKLTFSSIDSQFTMIKLLDLNSKDEDKLIKCFHPITERVNDELVTTFYFTIRNQSFIYIHDELGNQIKPAINCSELIKNKMNINTRHYSTRIMCLTIWSEDRFLAAGTGTGLLIIFDQKLNYNVILDLFRNPIICIQHTPINNKDYRFDKDSYKSVTISSATILDKLEHCDEYSKTSKQNSGLIVVGNGYKSIDTEYDGAALVLISDDVANISRQLDRHVRSRNDDI